MKYIFDFPERLERNDVFWVFLLRVLEVSLCKFSVNFSRSPVNLIQLDLIRPQNMGQIDKLSLNELKLSH